MPQSPRLPKKPVSPTTKRPLSAPMLLGMTALDTTWRAFVPVLGGVFIGIGLDDVLGIAPVATFICLILGIIVSIVLIARQLRHVKQVM